MALCCLLAILAAGPHRSRPVVSEYSAPAGTRVAQVHPGGVTILPNGRLLTPIGRRLYTGYDLWKVVVDPKGAQIVGMSDDMLTIYRGAKKLTVRQDDLAPAGEFTADGEDFIASSGEKGGLVEFDAKTWTVKRWIDGNSEGYANSYFVDFALSSDGKVIFALDVAHQQLVDFDYSTGLILSRTSAGREPYSIALDSARNTVAVANIGLYDYSVVPGGISHPAFGFPTPASTSGVTMEGKKVAGLGPVNTPDAQSIWTFDVGDPRRPRVLGKRQTGLLIHAVANGRMSVGGSAPCAVATGAGKVYVANSNNDTVQEFSESGLRLKRTFRLNPLPALRMLRGVIPSALCLSKSGSRLYVAESGLDALAAIDLRSGKVLGAVPTGWFPLDVKLIPHSNKLVVATQKGVGQGPLGPLNPRPESDERFGLDQLPGMMETFTEPKLAQLQNGTHQVDANDGLIPKPMKAFRFPSQIKHVVFIIKENHTFDGIFGGLPGANGQPRYAEFGDNGWIREKGTSQRHAIMPNHLKIAGQFAISDNFYQEPHYSGDGHRWDVGVYPSLWTTRVYYSGWNFRPDDSTKGRLVSFGSNASQFPEDYLENGSMWEHLAQGHVSFRNYGEGFEFPGVDEGEPKSKTGAIEAVNIPMAKVLFDRTCFDFPIFNTNIPDIARVDWFKDDIENNFRAKDRPLPEFMDIALCNDHGDSPRPKAGYPFMSSYLADDDLALGQLVEYLSHTPEWKSMAIFVTEDDPGGDNDHVDRHRSFVLAISPYIKHGYVSHVHTSVMSIIRSIYMLCGLGPNNLFDATASPLTDMFTDKPDFTPYVHVGVDPAIFDPAATFDPTDPQFKRRRREAAVQMDAPAFIEWVQKGAVAAPVVKSPRSIKADQ